MELQKKEIIKNYLLDESLPVDERMERFKIAWDVWENFENIKEDMRRKLANEIVRQLNSKEFADFLQRKDYEMVNLGLETKGMSGYPIKVFKRSWKAKQGEVPLFYALEFLRGQWPYFLNLTMGIRKQDNLNPFRKNWQSSESELSLEQNYILKEVMLLLENEFKMKWNISDWWIAFCNFDSYGNEWTMWKRKFYEKFFTGKGLEDAAQFYVSQFRKLIEVTETVLDKFIHSLNLK